MGSILLQSRHERVRNTCTVPLTVACICYLLFCDPHALKSKWQGCHVVGALGAEFVLVKNIKWYHRELPPSNQHKDFPCAIYVECTNTSSFFLSLSFFLVPGGSMARKGRERTASVRWRACLVRSRKTRMLLPRAAAVCLPLLCPPRMHHWLHISKKHTRNPEGWKGFQLPRDHPHINSSVK